MSPRRSAGDVLVRVQHIDVWSPDARGLAFVDGAGLWTVAADGTDARRLTSLRFARYAGAPASSPDGSTIAFLVVGPLTAPVNVAPATDNRRFARWWFAVVTFCRGDGRPGANARPPSSLRPNGYLPFDVFVMRKK